MKSPLYALSIVLLLGCACTPRTPTVVATNPLPELEILSPPSGTRVGLHEELEIESRSESERGLARIELWVDDRIYRIDEAQGQTSFSVVQHWRADTPGEHQLRVTAVDLDGQASQGAIVMVQVPQQAHATATLPATPTPTATPTVAPTAQPSPSPTAKAIPSATPDQATATVTVAATPTVEATETPETPARADMVLIPEGTFMMGSNPEGVQQATDWCGCGRYQFEDELYLREVFVSSFAIDRTEVTNQQFTAFVDATGYQTDAERKPETQTWRTAFTLGKENHPVVWMSWNDARAYCQWAGKRLPTEAEWEKAARGTDGRLWPWGNGWDSAKSNMVEAGRGTTLPVGSLVEGASPYGVLDMAGNVWEWVNDWYAHGYYRQGVSHDPPGPESGEDKVLRGGAFGNTIQDVRTVHRHKGGAAGYAPDHGFRCAESR